MRPLTKDEANAAYDCLVRWSGASDSPSHRNAFIYVQTKEYAEQCRFFGKVGSWSKFWRDPSGRTPGYVNCLDADETPGRISKIAATNSELRKIRITP